MSRETQGEANALSGSVCEQSMGGDVPGDIRGSKYLTEALTALTERRPE